MASWEQLMGRFVMAILDHTPVQSTGKSGLELRQLPKPRLHRSTSDRLRPIASRPPKFPKIQYEFGSISESTRIPPRPITGFVNERASSICKTQSCFVILYSARLHSSVIDETVLGLHYMQSAISGIVDDISGIPRTCTDDI